MFKQVLVSIIWLLACSCMQVLCHACGMQLPCHAIVSLQYPCQTKNGTGIAIAWNMPKPIGTGLAIAEGIPNQDGTNLANTKSIPTQNWHRSC